MDLDSSTYVYDFDSITSTITEGNSWKISIGNESAAYTVTTNDALGDVIAGVVEDWGGSGATRGDYTIIYNPNHNKISVRRVGSSDASEVKFGVDDARESYTASRAYLYNFTTHGSAPATGETWKLDVGGQIVDYAIQSNDDISAVVAGLVSKWGGVGVTKGGYSIIASSSGTITVSRAGSTTASEVKFGITNGLQSYSGNSAYVYDFNGASSAAVDVGDSWELNVGDQFVDYNVKSNDDISAVVAGLVANWGGVGETKGNYTITSYSGTKVVVERLASIGKEYEIIEEGEKKSFFRVPVFLEVAESASSAVIGDDIKMTFKFIESQSASGKEDGANFGSSAFGFTKDADISGTKPGDSIELVRSAPSDYSKQVLLETNRTYIDIEYLGSRGSSLNEDTITGAGNKNDEFEITGTGSNGIKLQDVNSPLKINEGVYRYFLDGQFGLGEVTIGFNADTWSGNDGQSNGAFTRSFNIIGAKAELVSSRLGSLVDYIVQFGPTGELKMIGSELDDDESYDFILSHADWDFAESKEWTLLVGDQSVTYQADANETLEKIVSSLISKWTNNKGFALSRATGDNEILTVSATDYYFGLDNAEIGLDEINKAGYIDVIFRGLVGSGMNHQTINGNEITIRDNQGDLLGIDNPPVRQIDSQHSSDIYRYSFTATFHQVLIQ